MLLFEILNSSNCNWMLENCVVLRISINPVFPIRFPSRFNTHRLFRRLSMHNCANSLHPLLPIAWFGMDSVWRWKKGHVLIALQIFIQFFSPNSELFSFGIGIHSKCLIFIKILFLISVQKLVGVSDDSWHSKYYFE